MKRVELTTEELDDAAEDTVRLTLTVAAEECRHDEEEALEVRGF